MTIASFAVALIAVAICSAAPSTSSLCESQSEKPSLQHREFRAYIKVALNGSYIPLNYSGRSSAFGPQVESLSYGNGAISTDCAGIHASLIMDAAEKSMSYSFDEMIFSIGGARQSCTLHPPTKGYLGEDQYGCFTTTLVDVTERNTLIATLVVEKLNFLENVYVGHDKISLFTWKKQKQ